MSGYRCFIQPGKEDNFLEYIRQFGYQFTHGLVETEGDLKIASIGPLWDKTDQFTPPIPPEFLVKVRRHLDNRDAFMLKAEGTYRHNDATLKATWHFWITEGTPDDGTGTNAYNMDAPHEAMECIDIEGPTIEAVDEILKLAASGTITPG